MKLEKKDMYELLINQEELNIIADCISATVINLEDTPEEEYTVKRYKEFLEILTPFATVATGIMPKE
jgi:hypothetical protein